MDNVEILINPPQEVFDQIVYWTGETEQWGFQLNDYNYWSSSYEKFWLFTVVEKGTTNLIASVSLALWECDDGPLYSVGMFYCKQEYRGNGYGLRIFSKIMDLIEDDNATLTGVVKMSDKYASVYGFDKVAPFWHLSSSIKMQNFVIPENLSKKFTTKDWDTVDLSEIHAYDRIICTRDRTKIMTNWFKLSETFTKVVLDESGKISGFLTIRIVSKNRLSAAPFYADSLEAAEVLLASVVKDIPNYSNYESIGFLYPECNSDGTRLCEKFSKGQQFTSVQFVKSQFTRKFIDSPNEKIFSMSDCAHQFV